MQDATKVLASPSEFGVAFNSETVKSDGIEYPNVPVLTVTDLKLFEASFPGVALESLNGQSVRVNSQRIGRDSMLKGIKDADAIRLKNVNWLNGVRVVSGVRVDQKEYEAFMAWKATQK